MSNEEQKTFFQMSDKTYDFLSGLVKYVLPGLATLYLALSALWVLPYGEQVAGTLMAFTAFLGIILGISKSNYLAQPDPEPEYDGDVYIDMMEEGEDLLTVALELPVDDVRFRDNLNLKVVRSDNSQTHE